MPSDPYQIFPDKGAEIVYGSSKIEHTQANLGELLK